MIRSIKSCSYCCNRCWKNPIFYIFLLKKKFQKKIFVQKKSKNQNWPIFDFSLIGSSVFELEPKTAKLRKQVELCPQRCFYLPVHTPHRQVEAPLWAKFYLLSQFCSFLALTRKPSFRSSWNRKLVNFDFFDFFWTKIFFWNFFFSKKI